MSDFGGGKPAARNAAEGGAAPASDDGGLQTYGAVRSANEFRNITSDREKITPVASSGFVSAVVVQEINAPAMCQVVFNVEANWADKDFEQFAPGRRLDIPDDAVQDEQLPPMYVSGLTLDGSTGTGMRSTLTVTAFDKMHFLRFGEYSKSFADQSDKDIFEWLVKTVGMKFYAMGYVSTLKYPFFLADNETRYDLLLKICRQGDYECVVKLDGIAEKKETLVVGKRNYTNSALDPPLFYNYDIEAINLDMRVPTLGETVTVRGYDISRGEPLSKLESNGSSLSVMKGKQTAFSGAQPFGESPVTLKRPDMNSEDTLDNIATAQRQRLQDTFIEGTVTLRQINLEACPGVNVDLRGINSRFDGLYHVVKSTHRIDRNRNFTILNVTRSGM
jgi:hypothetical protein